MIIKTENLSKKFVSGFLIKKTVALDGLNLEVGEGEIFGFLGPNGAGKTTTIKLLLGLLRPTAGEALLFGKSLKEIDVRRRIGYLPENPFFYEYLKAGELLDFYGQLFGFGRKERQQRIDRLLNLVGLTASRNVQLRKFSKGMIQRIGLAQALLNDPDLLILDEPQSGLDPIGRKEVRDIILRLKEEGKTIFFSSHILSDAEMICDRVAILNRAKLQETGTLEELLSRKIKSTEIVCSNVGENVLREISSWAESVVEREDQVLLKLSGDRRAKEAIGKILDSGGNIVSVTPQKESLEDIFIAEVFKK